MLAIEVAFLTGRYVATAYNSRSNAEWPPHPARLFSALAATHFSDQESSPNVDVERGVLEWLEVQGPPSILASDASERTVVTVFVPVNDVALTDVDAEAARVEQARTALRDAGAKGDARAKGKCATELKKHESALRKAIDRATAVPASGANPMAGARVLPEFRIRQPRTFPSVTPIEPQVTFVWPDASPTAEQREALDGLIRRVVRLGHSSTLVSMRVPASSAEPTWAATPHGECTLRVVQAGQLAALERGFDRHREIEPRLMPAVPQAYSRLRPPQRPEVAHSVFSEDWLVLRRVEGPQLPMTATAGVSRSVRRALMSYADEPIGELLSGHRPDGGASAEHHLAVLPLPFVGHQNATGSLLGVALVFPRDAAAEARQSVYQALARWEQACRQEDEDAPVIHLNLGAAGRWGLQRVEWAAQQATLRPGTWSAPSTVWHSATPVALDRNPGDLRARDPERQREAVAVAAKLIEVACVRGGLPAPVAVDILPAAPWAGAAKARHYPTYPGDAARITRVLTHARISFAEPVAGPIVLGAGRYAGLGLFRPEVAS